MRTFRIGIFGIVWMCFIMAGYFYSRGHGNFTTETITFTESTDKLENPERGFYYIYGFRINDYPMDYVSVIEEKFKKDPDTRLALILINLNNYKTGDISENGLQSIEQLFDALGRWNKKLIVRFLYDWNGENLKTEPETIDIVLRHMEQVGPILREYSTQIYTMQGLFVGNWGEMNGSKHLSHSDMYRLMERMIHSVDEETFLAVRTPIHWRRIIKQQSMNDQDASWETRVGLYNDGIMGNASDCGTYRLKGDGRYDPYALGSRQEELEFQNEIHCNVPNGGEVILENPLNDLENAIETLSTMRISYLNKDYDMAVLNKWKNSVVSEEGIYQGMNGYDYVERHLGYRFVLQEAAMEYDFISDQLQVSVNLKNVGFAPIYHDKKVVLTICDSKGNVVSSSDFAEDIRQLTGGKNADEVLSLQQTVSVHGWRAEEYRVYFSVVDPDTGEQIKLANEQQIETNGYWIGTITGGMN